MNTTGIGAPVLQSIIETCLQFKTVKNIILYGSRARGDYKQGADIDIAIDAPDMNDNEFSKLWNALEDLPIIYPMDIVHLQSIKNKDFLEAIHNEGIVLK